MRLKAKALLLFTLITFFFLIGCVKENNFELQITQYIKSNCEPNFVCTLRLNDLTNFAWESAIILDENISSDSALKVLDSHYYAWREFSGQIMFFKDDEFIRAITYRTADFDDINWSIDFSTGTSDYLFVTDENAVFEVRKVAKENGEGYILSQENQ